MVESLKDRACIVGIGETEYSKSSGRSEMRLALEAILAACEDAGIKPKEIDGIVRFSVDSNQPDELARNLGLDNVRFFPEVFFGGGAGCGIVEMAALAAAMGKANYVVCFRALNERSGFRYGQMGGVMPMMGHFQYSIPFGLIAPGAMVAVMARRHMHEFGTKTTDLGEVAVAFRKHANMNPKAMMYGRPMTLEDHGKARMISDPLRLFDFCQETDGAAAMIIASAERAKDLKQKPAYIMAAEQGMGSWMEMMTSYQREHIWDLEEYTRLAPHLWKEAGIGPKDIDCVQFYDAFTPLVIMQLESFGFCKFGEGGPFVRDGALQIGGRLPTNTSGGCLSEAYIHGLNQIVEGVRQVRGTSLVQVPDCKHVLVTAGSGIPTGALILGGR
ncbi:MAG: lipid-transfer protein [Dehalococcoidia bacterium]|nr:lipid-transfer protein [Dehalococcoidia bacterium]